METISSTAPSEASSTRNVIHFAQKVVDNYKSRLSEVEHEILQHITAIRQDQERDDLRETLEYLKTLKADLDKKLQTAEVDLQRIEQGFANITSSQSLDQNNTNKSQILTGSLMEGQQKEVLINDTLSSTAASDAFESIRNEIEDIKNWSAGEIYEIPNTAKFMKDFDGCTNGRIYWREEEKQVFSIMLNTLNASDKNVILQGSPGVGKSVMISLVMFYMVSVERQNVLILRKSNRRRQGHCVLYAGYDQHGKCIQYSKSKCSDDKMIKIFDELHDGPGEFMLFLDGFVHSDVPSSFHVFDALSTSQYVSDCAVSERILHPCWEKEQIMSFGGRVLGLSVNEMNERYRYSGGSIREFTRSVVDLESIMDEAVSAACKLSNIDELFACQLNSTVIALDSMRHIFLMDKSNIRNYRRPACWQQLVDSEYAIAKLFEKFNLSKIQTIYRWAKSSKNQSIAGMLYEGYIHRLGCNSSLLINIKAYPCNKTIGYDQYKIKNGKALQAGTASNYQDVLRNFCANDDYTYWYPAENNFPNINCIAKINRPSYTKCWIAFIQIMTSKKPNFDETHMKTLQKIFVGEYYHNAHQVIYIALSPDANTANNFQIDNNCFANASQGRCQTYVGYIDMFQNK